MAAGMFLKLAGIAGESQDAKHKGEIDILGWSWGLSEIPVTSGSGGGTAAGKPNFHQISVQKLTDLATAPLLAATAKGTHIATASLTISKSGAMPQEFLALNLKNVLITSVSLTESQSGERPAETVTLSFGQIDFEYTQFQPNGAKGATNSFKWDTVANKGF